MLRFIIQKLLNKKWLILCILIGNILLIGIACCNPMYTKAALQKMLTKDMNASLEEKNIYPGTTYAEAKLSNKRLQTYHSRYFTDYLKVNDTLESMYEIPSMMKIQYLGVSNKQDAKFEVDRASAGSSKIEIRVASLSDLGDHVNMLSGSMYGNTINADGTIDCVVGERVYLDNEMEIGEVVRFTDYKALDGSDIRLRIVGVFTASDNADAYWVKDPLNYDKEFFIDQSLFISLFMDGDNISGNVTGKWWTLFDYTAIETDQVTHMLEVDELLSNDYASGELYYSTSMYSKVFEEYLGQADKVVNTMWILQVPILILLCVFIFMVSNQVITIEASEIAMLKSRGVSRAQLLMTYFIQSSILAVIALIIGIPIGYLLCHVFGSTNAFMEFVGRRALNVRITGTSLLYALLAAFVGIFFMTAPVFTYARFSIVEQKANKRKKKKPMWQRMFLDFILLGIACYGFYNFNSQTDLLRQKVAQGEALDPMLFLSSTLFVLACAIVFLRVIPMLSYGIFRIGRKWWKPAGYASFLQITRDSRKQSFITVFLVLTIALGIFNANIARTINENEENRIQYDNGSTVILEEKWYSNETSVTMGYATEVSYEEPDFNKYKELVQNNESVQAVAKVLTETNADIGAGGTTFNNVMFMGIRTNDFGHSAWMPEGYTEEHWFNTLNALSQVPDGCIISRNLAEKAELEVGDTVSVFRTNRVKQSMGRQAMKVVAIVDYFPSYENTYEVKTDDGNNQMADRYLVVANLENVYRDFPLTPYEVWIRVDGSTDSVYDWISENKISCKTFTDTTQDIINLKNDPYFQITNGMLTLTFIVVIVLCAIGFLIYWITSIRSRELIFGIYRAMGMSMRELIQMLINEHLFGSILPILFGAAVGLLASKLFIPLISIAYSPSIQTLPTQIFVEQNDMIRIGVVLFLMLACCIGAISVLLSKIKINQALKLGED